MKQIIEIPFLENQIRFPVFDGKPFSWRMMIDNTFLISLLFGLVLQFPAGACDPDV